MKCYKASNSEDNRVLEDSTVPRLVDEGSGDGKGRFPPGGGGGGGDDDDEKEFGPIMKFEEVIREAEKMRVTLPSDIVEAAKTTGIRELLLTRYLDLQLS